MGDGREGRRLEQHKVIYLDHAATSWPKPEAVVKAVYDAMVNDTANPGRGSHAMAVRSSRHIFQARKQLAKLFRISNPNDIAFSLNTTTALNQAIKGFVQPGDHVISTAVEHNSVRRPLEYLKQAIGIRVTYIEADEKGFITPQQVEQAITHSTRLVIVNHSSNLLGTIAPIADIGEVCRRNGVKLLVDAAQSAGILPIDVEAMGIDMMAFPGHKGLLGPQGTGGLYIHPSLDLVPMLHGGTGSQSEAPEQPSVRPDRYEAGTPNTPGLAGLAAGVSHVLHETVQTIHTKEWRQTQMMMEGLLGIPGIQVLGPDVGQPRTGIVSFNLAGADASELSFILDQHYGIAVRAGYHCTPLAHAAAGTMETGAVRASVGCFTTDAEAMAIVDAMKEIQKHYSDG
ncbi:aminotransferase class V-fold PLP-dependent enzyme [Paenibacillus sp. MMS18-CY102]|nr:aminotransferase class V-fold PLP-dependent enzyme [Paenibacillus sp. MMS18-CY102]